MGHQIKQYPFKLLRVAVLNDAFRRTLKGGSVKVSPGVLSLPDAELMEVIAKVSSYDDFNKTIDPNEEHNFGCFFHKGERYLFHITYCSEDMQHPSDDPSNDEITVRVLSISKALGH